MGQRLFRDLFRSSLSSTHTFLQFFSLFSTASPKDSFRWCRIKKKRMRFATPTCPGLLIFLGKHASLHFQGLNKKTSRGWKRRFFQFDPTSLLFYFITICTMQKRILKPWLFILSGLKYYYLILFEVLELIEASLMVEFCLQIINKFKLKLWSQKRYFVVI